MQKPLLDTELFCQMGKICLLGVGIGITLSSTVRDINSEPRPSGISYPTESSENRTEYAMTPSEAEFKYI